MYKGMFHTYVPFAPISIDGDADGQLTLAPAR